RGGGAAARQGRRRRWRHFPVRRRQVDQRWVTGGRPVARPRRTRAGRRADGDGPRSASRPCRSAERSSRSPVIDARKIVTVPFRRTRVPCFPGRLPCGGSIVLPARHHSHEERQIVSEGLPVLHLARPRETAWLRSGQHTSMTDLPLTEAGERQADSLGRRLKGRQFARVFTSPLQRAAHTCERAGFGDVAEIDADLLEWNYGRYEGRTSKD